MSSSVHPLVRFAVERRVTMGMILVGLVVLGGLALQRLPLEFLPANSSSNVSVSASYASSSPEEIERLIVRPLEDSLGTLNNLDSLSARASADSARLDVSFVDGTDMDLAAVEVRDRVDRVRHLLPSDLRDVQIRRFQTSDIPVLRFTLAAPWPTDRLYDTAERIVQRRLERIEGVAQVSLRGVRSRQVQVRLNAARLEAHGLSAREVGDLLRRNHQNLSAGEVTEGGRKLLVRVLGELTTLEEIRRLPLGHAGLRLGDVAEVAYDFPRQESFDFLNGSEALTLQIYKTSSANLLGVVDRVKAELDRMATDPKLQGLRTRVFHDSSVDVREGLGELRNAGLLGGALAVLAVFLFLRRWRTTLLVGIAIPISVVFTFVLMYLLRQLGGVNLTLNVVSLMGLVLALGMLVDNSIVVIESIYRHMQEGREDSREAALHGASEVALPILASTATTLCVFIPVIFLSAGGGFFSSYLREIGTTVCIVMVASLLVALTVIPMAAALLLERETPAGSPLIRKLGGGYARALAWTLRHRVVFFLIIAALLWGSWRLFHGIDRTFGSRTLPRQVSIYVDTPRAYSLEEVRQLFEELVAKLEAKRSELDVADISYSFSAGSGRSRGPDRDRSIDIYLLDEDESRLSTVEARDKIRALLPTRPGVELRIAQSQPRHGSSGLEVELSGDDPKMLETLGRRVAARLEELPFLRDVDLSLDSGDDEVQVRVARARAAQLGLETRDVAQAVQGALSDRAISYLKTGEQEVELILQYREADRETLDELRKVGLTSTVPGNAETGEAGTATRLPLGALADFEVTSGPLSIERENRRTKISIRANSQAPSLSGRSMDAVNETLAGVDMPPGYAWSFGRWTRRNQEDQQGASFALIFALLLVYMLMAALFESFSHPLSIMLSIPFAFIGVGVVMKLAGQPRDNFTELGLLILVGVVVNNAIVLIDRVGRLRAGGMRRHDAILKGGQDRLRAILMTAVTTILGLFPMVAPLVLPQWFGPLEGRSATWAPVGLVILGGLTTSTFLTLMVIPTVYSLVDDGARFVRQVVRAALAGATGRGGQRGEALQGEVRR